VKPEASKTLKPGWRRVKFGDVVRLAKARSAAPLAAGFERYVGLEHLEPGDLRIRSWGNVADGVTFTNVFQPGQVLFGKRRAYQRKVAVADFAGVCSSDVYVMESQDPQVLLPELLPFICQADAFFDHAVGTSAGSLSPRTNWRQLSDYSFILPSISAQERLVEILRAAEQAHSVALDLHNCTNLLLQSALVNLYSRGVRNERLEKSAIGLIPASWQVCRLGDQYEVQLGKKLYNEFTKGDGQIPYLRNANVQWNRLDLTDVASMTFTDREWTIYKLQNGDILACEGRHVGKAALWRGELPEAGYQMALHRLRAKNLEQEPRFMLHCLRYFSISGRFRAVTGETTIPHLPAEAFKSLYFPFPPKHEQVEIANIIDSFYEAIASAESRVRHSGDILKSILAFE
jgi:type I restriction enzyme, S subunit